MRRWLATDTGKRLANNLMGDWFGQPVAAEAYSSSTDPLGLVFTRWSHSAAISCLKLHLNDPVSSDDLVFPSSLTSEAGSEGLTHEHWRLSPLHELTISHSSDATAFVSCTCDTPAPDCLFWLRHRQTGRLVAFRWTEDDKEITGETTEAAGSSLSGAELEC